MVSKKLVLALMSVMLATGLCPALAYAQGGGDLAAGGAALSTAADSEALAEGTCGTCVWTIDSSGNLVIEPKNGRSGIVLSDCEIWDPEDDEWLDNTFPWSEYSDEIVSVKFNGTVSIEGGANDMFADCNNLASFDSTGLDTSQATNMQNMFINCSSLKSLDLSSFKTSNVISMSKMFCGCSSLSSLDVSGFDTSSVMDMSGMFDGCKSLKSLDLSSFDSSGVTDMCTMFRDCASLKFLDLSGFETSNVEYMQEMFDGCKSLKSLDLSGLNAGDAVNVSYMFNDCRSLASLDLPEFDTASVIDMSYMFSGCRSLASLDLSEFDTSKVKYMAGAFNDCRSLKSLDLSGFYVRKAIDMSNMFRNCLSLKSLDLSGFVSAKVKDMSSMFQGCKQLNTITVSKKWRAAQLGSDMFRGCKKLVGGNGTKYVASRVGPARAVIDMPGQKGYLTCVKTANPMVVKGVKQVLKESKLSKKSIAINKARAFKFVKKAQGKVVFKKAAGSSSRIAITSAGVVKVKKGTARGAYKLRVKVYAAGNWRFADKLQVVALNVVVK